MSNLTMLEKQSSMYDKALTAGYLFADKHINEMQMLMQDEGFTLHGALKMAYMHGFIDGFQLRLTGDENGNTLQG